MAQDNMEQDTKELNIKENKEESSLPPVMEVGLYCLHRSWGFGKIKEINDVLDQVVIDFDAKSGHTMQKVYAQESLEILPNNHILAQSETNLVEIQKLAKSDLAEVIKLCIESFKEKATVETISKALCPKVVADWKKWWPAARRAMQKNGGFDIPSKKFSPLRLKDLSSESVESKLEDLRDCLQISDQNKLVATLYENIKPEDRKEIAEDVVEILNSSLSKILKSQLPEGLKLALLRDKWIAEAGTELESKPSTVSLMPAKFVALGDLLEQLSVQEITNLLRVLWHERSVLQSSLVLSLLPRAHQRLVEALYALYKELEKKEEFANVMHRLTLECSVTSELLLWLAKSKDPLFQKMKNVSLILAMISVIEKEQQGEQKRSFKLYEQLISDKAMIEDIIQGTPIEDIHDLIRTIKGSSVFEDLDKRSFLVSIIQVFPEAQDDIISEETTASEDSAPVVSWESLDKRKSELEEIVNKKIPENSKEIGIARSYGDLKENHEFKAAKEMQVLLMKRKAELETMIVQAQGTDFKEADTSTIGIGVVVTLKDKKTSELLKYTILGAWDSDPVHGVISYMTALAKVLMGKKVGDTVEIPTESEEVRKVTIEKIEAYC